jgi:hypothetical protein
VSWDLASISHPPTFSPSLLHLYFQLCLPVASRNFSDENPACHHIKLMYRTENKATEIFKLIVIWPSGTQHSPIHIYLSLSHTNWFPFPHPISVSGTSCNLSV